jgi:hypothetical protein
MRRPTKAPAKGEIAAPRSPGRQVWFARVCAGKIVDSDVDAADA